MLLYATCTNLSKILLLINLYSGNHDKVDT